MKVILIVEDDPDNACALQALLKGAGYAAAISPSPAAAAEWLDTSRCDLVLTDLFGREHCRHWREWTAELLPLRRAVGGTPIVGVSGRVPPKGVSPSALGLAALIRKPYDIDDLLQHVASLIGAA